MKFFTIFLICIGVAGFVYIRKTLYDLNIIKMTRKRLYVILGLMGIGACLLFRFYFKTVLQGIGITNLVFTILFWVLPCITIWASQRSKNWEKPKTDSERLPYRIFFFLILIITAWLYKFLWNEAHQGDLSGLMIMFMPFVGWVGYVWLMICWERGFQTSSNQEPVFTKNIVLDSDITIRIIMALVALPAIVTLVICLTYFFGLIITLFIPFPYSVIVAFIIILPIAWVPTRAVLSFLKSATK